MKLQRLYSLTRQAIEDYRLIDDGDRIAVGISGGKDSLTLLYALCGLRRFYPRRFELRAVTVDLGFSGFDPGPAKTLCERFLVPHTTVSTDIGKILFQERRESNPCSLCAKLRKGALNQAALDLGCNKVAYAHHRDDVIETALLSLMYEGRFSCFAPKTYLDRTGLTVIRPLIYVKEADVIGFRDRYALPVCKNPCPADGQTKREYVKKLTNTMVRENLQLKDNLFHAVVHSGLPGWSPDPDRPDRIQEPPREAPANAQKEENE